jgi:hypothetical protein
MADHDRLGTGSVDVRLGTQPKLYLRWARGQGDPYGRFDRYMFLGALKREDIRPESARKSLGQGVIRKG